MESAELEQRVRNTVLSPGEGSFSVGTVFGDYRVTAFLAAGGTAEIYCAEHVTLGTPAALKVAKKDDAVSVERIRAEAKILTSLHSLSFPAFYAMGDGHGRAYLVEELLEPREMPKGESAIARFLISLCAAVGQLHAHGIVHADLKPANILFRSDGAPVLIDIGGCRTLGTRGYAAPEQMIGSELTPAADIHALGVLAERLFVNHPPVRWRTLIRRATSSLPSERYSTAAAFARAIRWRHWKLWMPLAVLGVAAVSIAMVWCMRFSKDSAIDPASTGVSTPVYQDLENSRRAQHENFEWFRKHPEGK